MFTNFAADGRRHYSPQTTWRRSLRGDAAVAETAIGLVWLVLLFFVPFFYPDLTCAALLPWSQRPGLSYCNNEGRGSGSAGLLAAALVEPELLASTGLLLWSGGRAVTLPAEEPPPVFDLRLQSRLLAAATGAGAGEEAAASASVEELLDPVAFAGAPFVVAATLPPPALAPRHRRPRWPRTSPGRVEAATDGCGDAPPNYELPRSAVSPPGLVANAAPRPRDAPLAATPTWRP